MSVTRLNSASLCKNGWTDRFPVWGEQSRSPCNIVLHGGLNSPQRGEKWLGNILPTVDPLHISGMAEDRDFKFCTHIERLGPCPNQKYQQEVTGMGAGSRDLIWVSGHLHISGTAEANDSSSCSRAYMWCIRCNLCQITLASCPYIILLIFCRYAATLFAARSRSFWHECSMIVVDPELSQCWNGYYCCCFIDLGPSSRGAMWSGGRRWSEDW